MKRMEPGGTILLLKLTNLTNLTSIIRYNYQATVINRFAFFVNKS